MLLPHTERTGGHDRVFHSPCKKPLGVGSPLAFPQTTDWLPKLNIRSRQRMAVYTVAARLPPPFSPSIGSNPPPGFFLSLAGVPIISQNLKVSSAAADTTVKPSGDWEGQEACSIETG